jgi:hypothetical protein
VCGEELLHIVAAEEIDVDEQQQSVQPRWPAGCPRPVNDGDRAVGADEEVVRADIGVHEVLAAQRAERSVGKDAECA